MPTDLTPLTAADIAALRAPALRLLEASRQDDQAARSKAAGEVMAALGAWLSAPQLLWMLDAADAALRSKPLDDPRLQRLFGDAIAGAMGLGALRDTPPPDGHWLQRFYDIGAAETARVGDLTLLLNRVAYALKKAAPDSDLPKRASDYLRQHGLSSPLREAAAESAAAKDAEIDRLEHRISELTDADLPDSARRNFESQAEVLIRESERQTGEITALRQRAKTAEADARALSVCVQALRSIVPALNATRMIMVDPEARDYAGELVSQGQAAIDAASRPGGGG